MWANTLAVPGQQHLQQLQLLFEVLIRRREKPWRVPAVCVFASPSGDSHACSSVTTGLTL